MFHADIPSSDIVLICKKLQHRNKSAKNVSTEKTKEVNNFF